MKAKYTIDENSKSLLLESSDDGYDVVFKGFTSIIPMFDYMIVEKDEALKETSGGLVIPDSSKEKPSTGTVLAVGGGKYSDETGVIIPMLVKVGDRIIFPKLVGHTIKVNGEDKLLIKQSEILGIIE